LPKSASWKPTARSMARAGAAFRPSTTRLECVRVGGDCASLFDTFAFGRFNPMLSLYRQSSAPAYVTARRAYVSRPGGALARPGLLSTCVIPRLQLLGGDRPMDANRNGRPAGSRLALARSAASMIAPPQSTDSHPANGSSAHKPKNKTRSCSVNCNVACRLP
jgi:hypothetical protein